MVTITQLYPPNIGAREMQFSLLVSGEDGDHNGAGFVEIRKLPMQDVLTIVFVPGMQ